MEVIARKAGRTVQELEAQERQLLWERAEDAKCTLSTREQVPLMLALNGQAVNTVVTREEFRAAAQPLLSRVVACAQKALTDAGFTPGELQEVIPVGGGSCMRILQDELQRALGKPVSCVGEPHFAVALGTLLAARLRNEEDGKAWKTSTGRVLPPARQRLRDRTAHAVGVAVVRNGVPEPDGDEDFVNCVILTKGVAVPSHQVGKFELCGRGGTAARVVVAQGEHGALLTRCHRLGEFLLEDLPPIFDRPHPISIEFAIDRDGQITAVAYSDVDPSKRANLVVDYRQGVLRPEGAAA
jgi:molecular chaperone DnaK (HSP70)